MEIPNQEIDVVKLFYEGIWGSEHGKRLKEIGDELNKVRNYANEMIVDDLLSKTIVHLTLSAYFAGVVPIIRIEAALFVEKEFRNEYAYALALRAYIEVAGRLHKGMRLWRQYRANRKTLDELSNGVARLMAKYRPLKNSPSGIFISKEGGFNVMSLVQSLEDKIPDITETYDHVSSYVHGGFEEQMFLRKQAWISELKQEPNPIIKNLEEEAAKLRAVAFDDFSELLQITRPLRERYDDRHPDDKQ